MNSASDYQMTAAVLASTRVVEATANAAGLLSGACLLFSANQISRVFAALALSFWALQLVYAIRVLIDLYLLRFLGAGGSEDELDRWLAFHRLKRTTPIRPAPERCAGALGLWRKQLGALGVQILSLASALLMSR